MSGMIGADVEGLRMLAQTFEQSATRLRTLSSGVRQGIQLTVWLGPFAQRFRHTWDTEHSRRLQMTAEALEAAAGCLRSEAAGQERASAAGTATSPGLGHTGTSTRSVLETDPNVGDGDGVRIIKVRGEDGVERYVVHIAGTDPNAKGSELFDPFENADAVRGRETQTMRYVEALMQAAGITSRDQIMLVGYSQGGLLAQNIANSGHWGDPLIVTRASPQVLGGVGSHDILRFEVERDAVVDRLNPYGQVQDMWRAVGVHGSGTDHLVRGSGGTGLMPGNPITNAVINSNPFLIAADLGAGAAIHTEGLPFYGNLADEFDASTDREAIAVQQRISDYLGTEIVADSL